MTEYVKNAWYMVAWEEEIADEQLLTRTIMDRPMLFYRKADGGYAGMLDRCPHRYAPLSMGKREGDYVVCGYHGLTFDETGQCIRNPFSELIPPGCSVRAFRLEAKHTILWMWGGDAERADTSLIPDFAFLGEPGIPQGRSHIVMGANYELMADNLMDLSHIEFVHKGSFGGGGVIFRGTYSVKEEGETIWSNWWMPDTRPHWADVFLPPDVKTDHWMGMRWNAPATMMMEIGLCPAGQAPSLSNMPPQKVPHIITPETETSSHYFYAFARLNDQSEELARAFKEEDRPMVEAVQGAMGDNEFWSKKPVILHVDAGAVRARHRLMKMRRDEAGMTQGEAVAAE